jgi:hypothetical protein
MKMYAITSVLFLAACIHKTSTDQKKDGYFSNSIDIKNETAPAKNDTCGMYSEFVLLRDNLISKKIEQVAAFFDFPIKDQNIVAFIYSQDQGESQQGIILDVDGFRSNFGKIFPDDFLSLLEKTAPEIAIVDGYKEVDWENVYDNKNGIFQRRKLLYKVGDDTLIFRFIMENTDETGKYETVVEYFFRLHNCKLKFEKSIIAG